jgi:nitrite reductase/ring-hydroxylating ferredoxin subunit
MMLGRVLPVGWRSLIRESDLVPGKTQVRKVLGRLVGIAKINGRIYVFDGRCPHAGRSLRDSEVTPQGILVCPGHGLRFSLGSQPGSADAIPLAQSSFRVRNGMVEVDWRCLRKKRP